jgi:hypothetical protein
MDDGIALLAAALEDASSRHGTPMAVNRAAGDGEGTITLGRSREGRVVMIRQPLPGEGGRVTLNHPLVDPQADHVPARTLAWVETWALLELGAVRQHAERLARLGREAGRYDPRASMANAFLVRLLAGLGHDLGSILGAGTWIRTAEGYGLTIGHQAFYEETPFTRHLSRVAVSNAAVEVAGGMVLVNDRTDGRPVSDLVHLPGDAGRGCRIETARITSERVMAITAQCPITMLNDGDDE